MSSANEHILPPVVPPPSAPTSKQRISPLEYRNTDLVSRLLAATPPYLYNMSILPNTYFFSEMLRSFVQAKAHENRCSTAVNPISQSNNLHSRRRKRNWAGNPPPPPPPPPRCEWQQKSAKTQGNDKYEDLGNNNNCENWSKIPTFGNSKVYENSRNLENNPLELTMSSKNEEKQNTDEISTSGIVQPPSHLLLPPPPPLPPASSYLPSSSSVNSSTSSSCSTSTASTSTSSTIFPQNLPDNQNLLHLPPPPPMWYPPLYPTAPYAIDPLHFFIDLRVSGHIYDRKNRDFQLKELKNENQQKEPTNLANLKEEDDQEHHDILNRNRHVSAFSVPNPNKAINLSPPKSDTLNKNSRKFDVNSMLYSKSPCNKNKCSTNYIMSSIKHIYENIDDAKKNHSIEQYNQNNQEESNTDQPKQAMNTEDLEEIKNNDDIDEDEDEKEKERKKKMKDLRALIGLELVVDYMNYAKPNQKTNLEETNEEIEIMEDSKSPTVEVVDIPEDG